MPITENVTSNIIIGNYELKMSAVCSRIKKSRYKYVGIQLPDGLRRHYQQITDFIKKRTGAEAIMFVEHCYGACDIADNDFESIGVDCLLHFGHAELRSKHRYKIPTLFVEIQSRIDVLSSVAKACSYITGNVGIVTTVQHIHTLPAVKKFLKEKKIKAFVGRGDSRIKYPGQVLGCNLTAAINIIDKVDNFLFIGTGNFHPLSIALATDKEVIIADPEKNEARKVSDIKETILKQRYGAIQRAFDANSFGILIGTMTFQRRIDLAKRLKEKIERHNKKAFLMAGGDFRPEDVAYMGIDAAVSTACPRIAIDDYLRYPIPIITPIELEIILKERKLEDYTMDQIFGNEV